MKYENFEKAKSLVEAIDKHKRVLQDISTDNVSVKLTDGNYTIMTIGTWPSCEHSCQDIAASFVSLVKEYYERRLENLHKELDVL